MKILVGASHEKFFFFFFFLKFYTAQTDLLNCIFLNRIQLVEKKKEIEGACVVPNNKLNV